MLSVKSVLVAPAIHECVDTKCGLLFASLARYAAAPALPMRRNAPICSAMWSFVSATLWCKAHRKTHK